MRAPQKPFCSFWIFFQFKKFNFFTCAHSKTTWNQRVSVRIKFQIKSFLRLTSSDPELSPFLHAVRQRTRAERIRRGSDEIPRGTFACSSAVLGAESLRFTMYQTGKDKDDRRNFIILPTRYAISKSINQSISRSHVDVIVDPLHSCSSRQIRDESEESASRPSSSVTRHVDGILQLWPYGTPTYRTLHRSSRLLVKSAKYVVWCESIFCFSIFQTLLAVFVQYSQRLSLLLLCSYTYFFFIFFHNSLFHYLQSLEKSFHFPLHVLL